MQLTMNLEDTVNMMVSDDYAERFKAEYWQTVIRHTKLTEMLVKMDNSKLDFTPTCPKRILRQQAMSMGDYISTLEARAGVENINLWE